MVYVVEPRDGRRPQRNARKRSCRNNNGNKSTAINEARRLAQQNPLHQVVIMNESGRIERGYSRSGTLLVVTGVTVRLLCSGEYAGASIPAWFGCQCHEPC